MEKSDSPSRGGPKGDGRRVGPHQAQPKMSLLNIYFQMNSK